MAVEQAGTGVGRGAADTAPGVNRTFGIGAGLGLSSVTPGGSLPIPAPVLGDPAGEFLALVGRYTREPWAVRELARLRAVDGVALTGEVRGMLAELNFCVGAGLIQLETEERLGLGQVGAMVTVGPEVALWVKRLWERKKVFDVYWKGATRKQ